MSELPEIWPPMPFLEIERTRLRAAGVTLLPIPWDILAPHERQAQINHGQTLKRLQERGGLSASEAVAILEDRAWEPMELADAFNRLAEIVSKATP